MAKRKGKVNFGGTTGEHREEATRYIRMAENALKAAGSSSSCQSVYDSLIDVERLLAQAANNMHWIKGPLGKGKERLYGVIKALRMKTEASHDNFMKTCATRAKF